MHEHQCRHRSRELPLQQISGSGYKVIWVKGFKSSAGLRFLALVLLVTTLAIGALLFAPDRRSLIAVGHVGGGCAPLVAVLGSAVLAAAIVPRTLLALVGGAVFGWVSGTTYMLIGVTLGAAVAFLVGRLLGRSFVNDRQSGRVAEIDRIVGRHALLSVTIARLIPLVPFGISNYLFGASRVSARTFVLGTAVGAAPATLAYAALGSATVHGDTWGMAVSGFAATALGVGGYIGTYLVWRRRPRPTGRPGLKVACRLQIEQ
jgi:uncharacterized membrane protein YdjX (TVP38/TMEM64 family)